MIAVGIVVGFVCRPIPNTPANANCNGVATIVAASDQWIDVAPIVGRRVWPWWCRGIPTNWGPGWKMVCWAGWPRGVVHSIALIPNPIRVGAGQRRHHCCAMLRGRRQVVSSIWWG